MVLRVTGNFDFSMILDEILSFLAVFFFSLRYVAVIMKLAWLVFSWVGLRLIASQLTKEGACVLISSLNSSAVIPCGLHDSKVRFCGDLPPGILLNTVIRHHF